LASRLGIDPASPLRARAAIRYILQQLSNEGHCGFPEAGVIERTAALTGIDQGVVAAAVEHERTEGNLVRDPAFQDPSLYLKPLFRAEVGVARHLCNLREGPHPLLAIDTETALRWVEKKMGLELADSQRDALRQAAARKVLVVTGGPGTGKTTIVRGILEIFAA